jgi:AraC family transcriptional regulator of adaptative response / DNA-3-methyladenine glycosylase II
VKGSADAGGTQSTGASSARESRTRVKPASTADNGRTRATSASNASENRIRAKSSSTADNGSTRATRASNASECNIPVKPASTADNGRTRRTRASAAIKSRTPMKPAAAHESSMRRTHASTAIKSTARVKPAAADQSSTRATRASTAIESTARVKPTAAHESSILATRASTATESRTRVKPAAADQSRTGVTRARRPVTRVTQTGKVRTARSSSRRRKPRFGAAPEGVQLLDREICYRALRTRDARFDGVFYTAVVSTGIYCRPICPARTPKVENCIFLPSAAAAHQMGFRPCLRCRPEIAPGLAGWRGSANTVSRALSLIAQGAFDEDGVESLASRLGVGARHLRRLFDRYVGAAPVAVAQAHRVLFAKQLITETMLGMSEIALAAGFQSVRRFNDAFVKTYGRPPSALRRTPASQRADAGLTLKLGFSPPYDFAAMLEFLSARAIPRVEVVDNQRYRRTFALEKARGRVEVSAVPGQHYLLARIDTTDVTVLSTVVARLRHLFDLDADVTAIDAHLAQDPNLQVRVLARPGLRVPGAWDSFELAVRGVLGQQITVRAATMFAGRLVTTHGESLARDERDTEEPSMLFPPPEVLATADLTTIGLTGARSATLNALAAAVVREPTLLRSAEQLDDTIERLCRIPGVGPWTANYIAMRGLREPDAFPAADIGVLRALAIGAKRPTPKQVTEAAEMWRPWRAYATLRLWTQPTAAAVEAGA